MPPQSFLAIQKGFACEFLLEICTLKPMGKIINLISKPFIIYGIQCSHTRRKSYEDYSI